MIVIDEVRAGFYLDSVALMRIARALRELPGVEEAGLMIGTPANKAILQEAGILGAAGAKAGPGDLVIAIRGVDQASGEAAMAEARQLLDAPRTSAGTTKAWQPRTLRAALQQLPDANLALVSVPGDFAVSEARKALRRGLDVMIFSDNVPLAAEAGLKREAHAAGRIVMGPDCGTAIIGGVPLAFANVVPRGDIGIIGASGTGIQEISCLLARAGHGISHAIGTGGRDLKSEIGAITTLTAIDLFDADDTTRQVVLVSKPPSADVAETVLARIARSTKPYIVCFLGDRSEAPLRNAQRAYTLKDAARLAAGATATTNAEAPCAEPTPRTAGRAIRGLFSGGSLCAEAQVVLRDAGLDVASNVAIPGVTNWSPAELTTNRHLMLDLGDDQFTRGRPHPMIEPAVRDEPLHKALADETIGVVLLDVVLGLRNEMLADS